MHRRAALRLLGSGFALGGAAGAANAHPTPSGTDDDATPAPTRTDAGYGPLGKVDVSGATEAVVSDDGQTAYVAATTGYAIVDLSTPEQPTVLAERRDLRSDAEDGPLPQIYDVKQDGDTLLVVGPANGRRGEYLAGALVVDVSDPASPEHRGFYETDYPIHNCDLADGRAYLTANGSDGVRLDVLDVTDEPTRVGRWALTDYEPAWQDVPRSLRVLHDVMVQDGTAYLSHWDAGVWLLDVTEPAEPTVLGHIGDRSAEEVAAEAEERARSEQVSLPGNAHVVTVDEAGDLLALGREAWATPEAPPGYETDTGEPGGGPGGIDLYDVSDPAAPRQLSSIEPPPTVDPTLDGLWTTAHNCELRDGTLYSSWYRGGVKRHDVSDPATPVERTWWADPPHAEFWTARVGVSGETFVGSSRGTATSPAGLYVFPDESGTTTWGFENRVGETPTDSPTATPTATATERPTSTPAATTTSTDGPGFGVLAALSGLGVGALAWWRKSEERP
jgi:hypothetical protein